MMILGSNELLQIAVADRALIRRVHTGSGPDGVAWIGAGNEP